MDLSQTVLVEATFTFKEAVEEVEETETPVVVKEKGLDKDEMDALIAGLAFIVFILFSLIIIKCCCKFRQVNDSSYDPKFVKELDRITKLGNLKDEDELENEEVNQSKNKSLTATKNQVLPGDDEMLP